ncbi:MAG: putative nucleotidyltransferase substrate binding domain-containing protein [Rubricoccaceae bacterium]|nr:putative nucleotidyltransferase substrate binding domain-containing protein [Rubricoccaceae bacterium]
MSSSITERLAGLLERTVPFSYLSGSQRRGLISTLEIFEPGEIILEQGQDVHRALYVVESGLVRLMNVEEQRLIDMCGEGAQFGSYGLMQGGILPYEARAVEPTTCALVSADYFRTLLKENDDFAHFFEEDIKRYVRGLDTDLDASGAFLLFDTAVSSLLRGEPATVGADATVREAARVMSEIDADAVVVVQEGAPVGVVTEGDLVEKVVAAGKGGDTPVMALVEKPPIALGSNERLFDAVKTMMRHRIRRVIVVDPEAGEAGREDAPLGLGRLSTDDISHYRGLDPVATTELIERAASVEALADIRAESNRRLLRLYQQGVQSEDLLDVIAELDDQLKRRLLHLVEQRLREERPEAAVEGPAAEWAWLSFGTPGRRESTLFARQDNGLVYGDPTDVDDAAQAAAWYGALAEAACDGLEQCGLAPFESGILARQEAFRQPLSQWQAAYRQWAEGVDAQATRRAAVCFDVRPIHGDVDLGDALLEAIAAHVPTRRLITILMAKATEVNVPISFFGRFELDRDEAGREGFDLRTRGIRPVVDMARALALEAGYLKSTSTFDRLRHVAGSESPSAAEAKALLPAFRTLADLHIRHQMRQAEVGEPPDDWVDPGTLHKSQQNLLKETLKTVQEAQQTLSKRYGAS